jgi:hypothetical protein
MSFWISGLSVHAHRPCDSSCTLSVVGTFACGPTSTCGVAVAAVHAHQAGVQLVAVGDRLLRRVADVGVVGREPVANDADDGDRRRARRRRPRWSAGGWSTWGRCALTGMGPLDGARTSAGSIRPEVGRDSGRDGRRGRSGRGGPRGPHRPAEGATRLPGDLPEPGREGATRSTLPDQFQTREKNGSGPKRPISRRLVSPIFPGLGKHSHSVAPRIGEGIRGSAGVAPRLDRGREPRIVQRRSSSVATKSRIAGVASSWARALPW